MTRVQADAEALVPAGGVEQRGELGDAGCAAFLSEPRFDDLPCVLETQGPDKTGPSAQEVARAVKLRERGVRARRG